MQTARQLPLQQHPNFAAALRQLGAKTRAINIDGSEPVQTVTRFGMRFASRGPIWHDTPTDIQTHALKYSGLHLINSNGGDHAAFQNAGFRQIMKPRHVAELSILGTPEDRMRRLKGKWRNGLRQGAKHPQTIETEPFHPSQHQWLLKADLAQQKAKGFRSLPHRFLIAYARGNPDKTLVMTSRLNGEPIAAMLFLLHGKVATYHLGWTSPMGRTAVAHHTILMRAGDHLSKQAVERIDLGMVDVENAPGLARFKLGTGASLRPLGGTWARLPWF